MPGDFTGTARLYDCELGLLTDFYQLTMAAGYVKHGMAEQESVFHLFFRRPPFGSSFAVACGTADIPTLIERMTFSEADLAYLRDQKGRDERPLFDEAFLRYLSNLNWSVSVDAIPEGTITLGLEPIVRVRGPLLQCQLLETALLTVVNFQTLIATKAARVCRAARGKPVVEFGLRRAQGLDGGLSASRAAYIGGCYGTSNVLAGRLFGIPIRGTHAHSWVMAHESEEEAFRRYANTMPGNTVLLVDTYNTRIGVERAVRIAKEMKTRGQSMAGVRLDSGDLLSLAKMTRQLLNDNGLSDVKIFASNDLDEQEIARLEQAGSAIDVYAVGTRLVTAADQPALGGVYKLSAIRQKPSVDNGDWEFKLKRSEERYKSSLPGILDTRRYLTPDTKEWLRDEITHTLAASAPKREQFESATLLEPLMHNGKATLNGDSSIETARNRLQNQLTMFRKHEAMFDRPNIVMAELSQEVVDLREKLLAETNT
jgi:nicotinate phosphoribosyltransferase